LPYGLAALRKAFKEKGMIRAERETTYAIKHTRRVRKWFLFRFMELILFELTCEYGLAPLRPLALLVFGVLVFSIPYGVVLKRQSGRAGIWRVWPEERILKYRGRDAAERAMPHGLWLPWFALYFSVLSAFHIGWRNINVGNWLARIQPGEYTLQATGWVRAVSGAQSLFSIYMLVLFILTYFGRPFENF
jgi:hypothetical protein